MFINYLYLYTYDFKDIIIIHLDINNCSRKIHNYPCVGYVRNIGIDTSAVTLSVKTNLNWSKLDNGNLQFTWKDSADTSPKYVSLQIVQNTELDFHESTRIAMNYTAHRE